MRRVNGFAVRACLLAVTASAVGCFGSSGPPTGWVEGTVTLKGTPLADGSVKFYSTANGEGALVALDPAGKYRTKATLPTGEYKVAALPKFGEPGKPAPPPTKIPKKYQSEASSGLALKVEPGRNTFDIKID